MNWYTLGEVGCRCIAIYAAIFSSPDRWCVQYGLTGPYIFIMVSIDWRFEWTEQCPQQSSRMVWENGTRGRIYEVDINSLHCGLLSLYGAVRHARYLFWQGIHNAKEALLPIADMLQSLILFSKKMRSGLTKWKWASARCWLNWNEKWANIVSDDSKSNKRTVLHRTIGSFNLGLGTIIFAM